MAESTCIILGGAGYIGHRWAERLAARKTFSRIVLADVRPPAVGTDRRAVREEEGKNKSKDIAAQCPYPLEFIQCDVRRPLAPQLGGVRADWIFHFSAVHREPGHAREEYFDTNLPGARHACAFAEETGCRNILFTSSIAVYGPTNGATTESSPLHPVSAYGISKLAAELIHEGWQRAGAGRRLIVCRPGVVYGPGDPGNILRMIRAVKKGRFVFPGSRELRKSYAYIEGLLDSFEFTMARMEERLTYNYVERETEPLGELVRLTQEHLGRRGRVFTAPLPLLQLAAAGVQVATGGRSGIHPARVRKAAMSTHIVPQVLEDLGFDFRFDFRSSLKDWASRSPSDFA